MQKNGKNASQNTQKKVRKTGSATKAKVAPVKKK